MPPFKLQLTFDGVCAFVPSRNRDKVRVILVNGINPGRIDGHAGHLHLPPHYACIRFPMAKLDSGASTISPDLIIKGDRGIKLFNWEDLDILPEKAPSLKILGGRIAGSAQPHNDAESRDFSWVGEMEKLAISQSGEIDPACVSPDPARNLVIGRVSLDRGEIGTGLVAGAEATRPFIWNFRGPTLSAPASYSQALAQSVQYVQLVEADQVTLRFRRFSSQLAPTLVFKSTDGTPVMIDVFNLPIEDILCLRGGAVDFTPDQSHFALIYNVARFKPREVLIPNVVGHSELVSTGSSRAATTLCLGLTFTGSD